MNIDEAWKIFLLGVTVFILTISFTVWQTFRSEKKYRRANNYLLYGFIFAVVYTIFLFLLFGWLPNPLLSIEKFLTQPIQIERVLADVASLLTLFGFVPIITRFITDIKKVGQLQSNLSKEVKKLKSKTDEIQEITNKIENNSNKIMKTAQDINKRK